MVISPNGECCEVDSAKAEPPPFKFRKSDAACASSLWRVISPVGECCEAVITRRSWKFASTQVAKTQKSLVNTDFSGTPKATKNSISKNISKKLNIRWYLPNGSSYTEGYRSGHNEAVLKTVWAHAHKGSNPFPSAIKPRIFGAFFEKIFWWTTTSETAFFGCASFLLLYKMP